MSEAIGCTQPSLRRENERPREVEERLQECLSMLEAAADGIVVVDLSGKIKGFNRQFQRI